MSDSRLSDALGVHVLLAQVLFGQVLALLVVTCLLQLLFGFSVAGSLYCGGVSAWLPTAILAWISTKGGVVGKEHSIATFYFGELFKIVASVAMLWLALYYYGLHIGPLLAGYVLIMVIAWLVPGMMAALKSKAHTSIDYLAE